MKKIKELDLYEYLMMKTRLAPSEVIDVMLDATRRAVYENKMIQEKRSKILKMLCK